MTRTKLLFAATTMAIAATEAHAQSCGGRTLDQIIASCDSAFPPANILIYSARGWCYLINSSSCIG